MVILLTNIKNLNKNIINESVNQLNFNYNLKKLEQIKEIVYLKDKDLKNNDLDNKTIDYSNLKDITINKSIISMDEDMETIYDKITSIIQNLIDKKEFINVIVDTSFLGYIILEILIKKFNIVDVFILENGKLTKAHPCGCDADYIGY
jgi:hypothetical protein